MQSSGFLLIDKPQWWTSFDIVAKLRGITGIRKIGHAGTLDPFATGLLIIAVGKEATSKIEGVVGMEKEYDAEFVLGATTESFDTEKEVIVEKTVHALTKKQISEAIKSFIGDIEQVPPMHSSVMVGGKRLYSLARAGKTIKPKPRKVKIIEFKIIGNQKKQDDGSIMIPVHIKCSSGTYIRALARDLASALGTVGYVKELRRTKIGEFDVSNALKITDITSKNWQTLVKNL